jgi:glycosyltransferase involved in cell wall biosynthesis
MAYEVLYEILEKGIIPDSDFKNQISRATGIIVDSVAVEQAVNQIFKFKGNYLHIPYGVDSALFTEIKLKNNEKIHIAAIRNWSDVHRQSELIPFVTKILEDEKNVIIHLAGSGPKKPEALKKIKKFLKSGQIIDHGNVSNEEILDILRASHIFLSNSRIDGSSVSMLEAMAVGTLVITTNTIGNRYWINSDVNGFLFNESPTLHTLKAIDLIKNRHEDYLKMIENAQSKAFKNANWEINRESMCIFIEQNNNEQ